MKRKGDSLTKSTSAILLGLPEESEADIERSKKRRVDIKASCSVLGESAIPSQPERFAAALRLIQCICKYHTVKATDEAYGDVHLDECELNPFVFETDELKALHINVGPAGDPAYDAVITNGTKSVSEILGSFQRQLFINAVIEAATMHPALYDATAPLTCALCEASHPLFTIADEYERKCCHPQCNDTTAWATDVENGTRTFSSRRPDKKSFKREGSAVCAGCLYGLILKDAALQAALLNLYDFDALLIDNLDETSQGKRFCSCVLDHAGVICLFQFSLLVQADVNVPEKMVAPPFDRRTLHQTLYPHLLLEPVTLDPTPQETCELADAFCKMQHYTRGKQAEPIDFKAQMAKLSGIEALTLSVHARLDPYSYNTSVPLSSSEDALKFVQDYEPVVNRFFDAQRILVRDHGDKILAFRDKAKHENVVICPNCGGYGHNTNKQCIMCIDPKTSTRGNQSLTEHFAENVTHFGERQKETIHAALDLQQWEMKMLNNAFMEYFIRRRQGQRSRRIAPTRDYILHGNKSGKNKTATCLSPSLPLAMLSGFTADELINRVDMSLLMKKQHFDTAKKAWEEAGHFDTSDFDLAYEWINYAAEHNLSADNVTEHEQLENLLQFINYKEGQ